jgi:type II secretory ATPase GspE/PulE/Tfp pilus assembly ATPase PilB-like protein
MSEPKRVEAINDSAKTGASAADMGSRLAFFRALQGVTNKIHATQNLDEIVLELGEEITSLFNADRLTIYVISDDRKAIVSKVKTGLKSFKDIRLPLNDQSVAGYSGTHRALLNIRDVYDAAELKAISQSLRFLQEVDKRTGYRTQQMLVAPIIDERSSDLLGVIQLINHRAGTPFSLMAEEGVQGLAQTLAIAFTQRARLPSLIRSKYDALLTDAVISLPEFETATATARRKGISIEDVLVGDIGVEPAVIGKALSAFFRVPYEPFRSDRMKPLDLLRNIKREYVEEYLWLPLEETQEGIVVLALDPERVRTSNVAQNVYPKSKLAFRVTTQREFLQTMDLFFGPGGDVRSVGEMLLGLDSGEEDLDEGADVSAAAENELVKLVNKIILDAYHQGASDIHVEPRPGKEKTQIRIRKDGSLVPYIEIPASYRNALVTRIKIMCDLDISERRKPQDGKIKFKRFGPADIELRVATLPSSGGMEDVVMRILQSGEPIPMDKLGLLPDNIERLKATISKPYGIFFVCGPTGSGKTTTLHSILSHLNTPETKIWTAEDPVEITQKGLRQVQVNRKAGLDFATAMRAFLRADPDIIMVGEMRDKETVSIGLEASLTGHLVFATLHTNSAPESIIRLLDMGMDPFNFADALLGVLAQRLAKRLCSKCRKVHTPKQEEIDLMLDEYCSEFRDLEEFKADPAAARAQILDGWKQAYGNDKGKFTLYEPVGCGECADTGYRGRIGLHELLIGSDTIKRLIQEHARVAIMLQTALSEGMRTLKMDGIEKVLAGFTDMKQVRKVCIK